MHDGYSVAWSPDGQRLVTACTKGTIDVWAKDGTRLHELQGHYGRANAAAWIGTDQILSAGSDVTLRMWDASSAKPASIIMVLPRHQIAKFSPYGELEYATDKALNEIIYAVEDETGKLDLLSPIDFHQKSGLPLKVVGTLRVP